MRKQKKMIKPYIDESVPMEEVKDPDADMTFHNLATLAVMAVDSCAVIQVDVNAIDVSPMSTCSSLE